MAQIKLVEGLTPFWFDPNEVASLETEFNDGTEIDPNPPEFQLKPLTQPQLLDCLQYFDIESQTVKPLGLYQACKYGLIDWKNIYGANGAMARFTLGARDKLPANIIAQIGAKLISSSQNTEDEIKNS